MQMAAAGWSQVQGRKVSVPMSMQGRVSASNAEREGAENARASSPPPPHDLVDTDELCQRRFQTPGASSEMATWTELRTKRHILMESGSCKNVPARCRSTPNPPEPPRSAPGRRQHEIFLDPYS